MGFLAYGSSLKAAWAGVGFGALLNWGISLIFAGKTSPAEFLYFALMNAVFMGILAPPVRQIGLIRLTLPYRFILGSILGSLLFFLVLETSRDGFDAFLLEQGRMLSSLYIASAGTDVVQRSLLEQSATPEIIAGVLKSLTLRGGGFVSCLFMFFISRQMGLFFVRLIRRKTVGDLVSGFRGPSGLIWVLSGSLLGVVASKLISFGFLEILAWNGITICCLLYLVQGWGIVQHFLGRKSMGTRLILNILMIFLLFTPGINLGLLGGLILLGIAEHWVPLRAPKSDGSSSTPGM
jgi:hypothetical protein